MNTKQFCIKRICLLFLTTVFSLGLLSSAQAATRASMEEQVFEWAGSGANSAYVVFDFDDYTTVTKEFVLGCRFDTATANGLDVLTSLALETNLEIVDAGGGYITEIAYTYKDREYRGIANWPATSWSYWETVDYGDNWATHGVGVASRTMNDGDVDGWSFTTSGSWPGLEPNGPTITPRDALREDVIAWAGTGANEAFFSIDFDDATTASRTFVLGFRFDEASVNALDAFTSLALETPLEFVDLGGGYITEIGYEYKGHQYYGVGNWPATSWTYWESTDFGRNWATHGVGIGSRTLTDGDVDGWAFTTSGSWPGLEPNGPVTSPRVALREDVIAWTGTGANEAFFSLDFDDATTASRNFVLGFRFDEPFVNALDAFTTLALETPLEFVDYGGGYINEIGYQYKDHHYYESGNWPDSSWSYWESTDSGQSWATHMVGIGSRTLADGDVDGWSFTTSGSWPGLEPNGPVTSPRIALEEDVLEWVGSGANTAFVSIDFDDSLSASRNFIFGVRFDGLSISGLDALNQIATSTSLQFTDLDGGYIIQFSYEYKDESFDETGSWPDSSWSYWESLDGGASWATHMVGATTRQLTDGALDGWAYTTSGSWPGLEPNGPVASPRESLKEDTLVFVGEGENLAFVVVDFDDYTTTTETFVFGVRFDGIQVSGLDALDAIAQATQLDYVAPGGFLNEISFTYGGQLHAGTGSWPDSSWGYWESTDYGINWATHMVGMADRVIIDGNVDGWAYTTSGTWPGPPPGGIRVTGAHALNSVVIWDLYQ